MAKKNRKSNNGATTQRERPQPRILAEPKFVDELPAQVRGGRTSEYITALKPLVKHKNRFALIAEFDKPGQAASAASYLRKDPNLLPGSGRFEFATRTVDGKGMLFGKYLG